PARSHSAHHVSSQTVAARLALPTYRRAPPARRAQPLDFPAHVDPHTGPIAEISFCVRPARVETVGDGALARVVRDQMKRVHTALLTDPVAAAGALFETYRVP